MDESLPKSVDCDRLAPWYRPLETLAFGRGLQRRRTALLPWALADTPGPPRRALLLGEGDGRFGAALLAAARPGLTVEVVDGSAAMLDRARGRYPPGSAARFHHAEARAWLRERGAEIRAGAAAPFDLVVTLFFLDCFSADELPGLAGEIAGVTAPRTRWLVADFRQPPGGGFRAWRAWVWLGAMYAFFRWTTGLRTRRLADFRPHLHARGFRCERVTGTAGGLLVVEGWVKRGTPTTGGAIPAAATTAA